MKRYWYKFRVKYGKAFDTGKNKKVSEEYLVDAEKASPRLRNVPPKLLQSLSVPETSTSQPSHVNLSLRF